MGEVAWQAAAERMRDVARAAGRGVDARRAAGRLRATTATATATRRSVIRPNAAEREHCVAGGIGDETAAVGARLAPADRDERERRGEEAPASAGASSIVSTWFVMP